MVFVTEYWIQYWYSKNSTKPFMLMLIYCTVNIICRMIQVINRLDFLEMIQQKTHYSSVGKIKL